MSKKSRRKRKHNQQIQYQNEVPKVSKKKFKNDIDIVLPYSYDNIAPIEISKTIDNIERPKENERLINKLYKYVNDSYKNEDMLIDKENIIYMIDIIYKLYKALTTNSMIEYEDMKLINTTIEYILEIV